MTDPYRLDRTPASGPGGRRNDRRGDGRMLRALLWAVLIISAVGNAVTSFGGFPLLVAPAFGLVTVACIMLLVVHHVRHRR
ncbi:hypothetical protein FOF52_15180 [Thermobifida alba]|uniref:Integral membrane protein n=1 Tax=Thermobifida alba TaxID=53522 RepID=A0ABY4KZ59_THEAE|nr:hypothetical protein [Thermobifida alba]UPT19538.1 hypothetical protein FOF52_15180 [Thermobifida alba]